MRSAAERRPQWSGYGSRRRSVMFDSGRRFGHRNLLFIRRTTGFGSAGHHRLARFAIVFRFKRF
jgi:hypothetical protein